MALAEGVTALVLLLLRCDSSFELVRTITGRPDGGRRREEHDDDVTAAGPPVMGALYINGDSPILPYPPDWSPLGFENISCRGGKLPDEVAA